jgi:colanic acid biosynthesis glycosyl transferase WcaI
MHILITTQVYLPEGHATAIMVQELAEDLSRWGAEVTVAAGYPHHPYGRLYPGFRKEWLKMEAESGFRVIRGWHLIHPSHSLAMRGLVMASQCAAFFLSAVNCPRPDVVISCGPPILGPLTSALIARASGARLVTIIYDIYPDIAVESGQLRNPTVITLARKLERFIYRQSERIVVLSKGFRRTLIDKKGVEPQKVAVIPVWLDVRDIFPLSRDNPWRREMGISPDKFVVLYAGTIGLVSGAEVVVEAASRLESYQDILILFVGAGYAKDRVEAKARELGLKNIRFLPFQPRERLSEVQATADVSLVTLAPGRGKTSVPSKVLGYMAAARPVIAAVDDDCDTAELIRKAHCGLVIPPAQAERLSDAILNFYQGSEARKVAGENGSKYFERYFERSQVTAKYIALIEGLSTGSIEPGNR